MSSREISVWMTNQMPIPSRPDVVNDMLAMEELGLQIIDSAVVESLLPMYFPYCTKWSRDPDNTGYTLRLVWNVGSVAMINHLVDPDGNRLAPDNTDGKRFPDETDTCVITAMRPNNIGGCSGESISNLVITNAALTPDYDWHERLPAGPDIWHINMPKDQP
jgi:hypothetical protein